MNATRLSVLGLLIAGVALAASADQPGSSPNNPGLVAHTGQEPSPVSNPPVHDPRDVGQLDVTWSQGVFVDWRNLDKWLLIEILAPDLYQLVGPPVLTPLQQCIDAAVQVCGQGQVCWVCVYENSCSFACRDADGGCEPAPPCGPTNRAAE